jgi:hypothetical protein
MLVNDFIFKLIKIYFNLPEGDLVAVAVVGAAVGGFWVEPIGGEVLKSLNFTFR